MRSHGGGICMKESRWLDCKRDEIANSRVKAKEGI